MLSIDDFGICEEIDKQIIEFTSTKKIDSISIVVTNRTILSNKYIDKLESVKIWSLHLNLTEGMPLVLGSNTLVKANGTYRFRAPGLNFILNIFGLFSTSLYANISKEIEAQINLFKSVLKENGKNEKLIYLDGHEHVHMIPLVSKILNEIAVHHSDHQFILRLPKSLIKYRNFKIANLPKVIALNSYSAIANIFHAKNVYWKNSYIEPFWGNYHFEPNLHQDIEYIFHPCHLDGSQLGQYMSNKRYVNFYSSHRRKVEKEFLMSVIKFSGPKII
jgi:predicted glycoside hydrolase/deacetylase ChbG (UPF0249 family)